LEDIQKEKDVVHGIKDVLIKKCTLKK